ncbi:lytic transglycosylase domain-containing protein [Burkholderia stagnalis]
MSRDNHSIMRRQTVRRAQLRASFAIPCMWFALAVLGHPAGAAEPAARPAFNALAKQCAPQVHPDLLGRVASVESSGNPFAIGVVHGHLARQPKTLAEALATVAALDAGGWNYSMGIVQVNVHNLERYGQTVQSIFDPCTNLKTGAAILTECFERARREGQADPVRAALSCYYSGDFLRGTTYAMKVAAAAPVAAVSDAHPIEIVPDVGALTGGTPARRAAKSSASRHRDRRDDWFQTYGDDDDAPTRQVGGARTNKGDSNAQ